MSHLISLIQAIRYHYYSHYIDEKQVQKGSTYTAKYIVDPGLGPRSESQTLVLTTTMVPTTVGMEKKIFSSTPLGSVAGS